MSASYIFEVLYVVVLSLQYRLSNLLCRLFRRISDRAMDRTFDSNYAIKPALCTSDPQISTALIAAGDTALFNEVMERP